MKKTLPIAILLASSSHLAFAQEAKTVVPDTAASDDIQKVVIVSTGSRGSQRTVVDTPVPIDIIAARELNKTGQVSLDKALQYRVPSFNTVQTPVNDATSLLDPYEIRNMGPSRSLILINGKRKNSSALIYTQTSPGRGESGADISAIPADAIKRIEVLRDGASAQYGSDAISGVVNIILKDDAQGGSFTARTGMTHEKDGKTFGASLNKGLSLDGKGFLNYTVDVSSTGLSNRPGVVNAKGEAGDFGADLNTQVLPFLKLKPDAGNINGSPRTDAAKALVNTRYDISDTSSVYANAAFIEKKVFSYANYRTPYWRPTDYGLLHAAGTPYNGYVPDFVGRLDDYNATVGTKFQTGDWLADLSLTTGGNHQVYGVHNSVNRGMQQDFLDKKILTPSPTSFDAGGVEFTHWVVNGDISSQVAPNVNVYAGTELRHESYKVIVGDPASYYGSGADSYAGNSPQNVVSPTRSNYGVYGGATWDISPAVLLDATGRYEKYTDFGSAFVWKTSTRFKISDAVTLRASASTGFRAPSLAQIYTQKAQYSFVAGGAIQVSGLIDNAHANALGVPKLKAEKSDNFTLGLGLKPDNNTSVTVDFYRIKLKDRVVLSTDIKPICDASTLTPAAYTACVAASPLDQALKAGNIVSASFFVNSLTSITSGIDYVASRRNIPLADGKLSVNLSGNYSLKNEREGNVNNPKVIADAHQSVTNATTEALMFTSRPKFKTILGFDWDYQKLGLSLNNTVFGPTYFRNAGMDDNLEVAFKTKTVTDFGMTYAVTPSATLSFNVNNMFNVTPTWHFNARNAAGQALLDSKAIDPSYNLTAREIQSNLVTFNGRYSGVTYDGSQFSQLGRMYALSLNVRF